MDEMVHCLESFQNNWNDEQKVGGYIVVILKYVQKFFDTPPCKMWILTPLFLSVGCV